MFDRPADHHWVEQAFRVAETSHDLHTQVGAVLVDTGNDLEVCRSANRFPMGLKVTTDRLERPAKYDFCEHAERDVLYQLVRRYLSGAGHAGGESLCLYMNWAPMPCVDCARALIATGVRRVCGPGRPFPSKKYASSVQAGLNLLIEAGVEVSILPFPLPEE